MTPGSGTQATAQKRPLDFTKPMVTLKTSWNNAKANAKVPDSNVTVE
jgi:hypothetical protein